MNDNQIGPASYSVATAAMRPCAPLEGSSSIIRSRPETAYSHAGLPSSASTKTLVNVQILRGIAALLVVFHHYIGAAVEKGFAIAGLEGVAIGNVGVDIFFIISGFIMEYVCGARSYAPGDRRAFMINRMQRILPLYWVLTILAFGAFLLLQGAVNAKLSINLFLERLTKWKRERVA